MSAGRNRGRLTAAIRMLLNLLHGRKVTEDQFKARLSSLIDQYSYLGTVVYQDVGLALRRWITSRYEGEVAQYWQLADEVNPQIRRALDHWLKAMEK